MDMPRLTAEELVAAHRPLSRVDHREMSREADEFFGDEDRVLPEVVDLR
jgi:hypothetical protein